MKYEVINIRTIENEFGGLSFFEGEHDIPFAIKHLCCIYKTDEERKRTFYTDAASQLLMFCPYGEVEVIVNDDLQQESIMLDNPAIGLLLQNGMWEKLNWRKEKSVVCVAVSELLKECNVEGELV